MRRRYWQALAVGTGLLLTGCSLLPPEADEAVIQVSTPVVTQREVLAVKRGALDSRLKLTATFGAERQAALYFRSSGRIRQLYARTGQKVAAGEVLAELEAGSLPYDLEAAKIDLERARLKLEQARSRAGFVDAPRESDLKGLELDLRQAELRLRKLQHQLADLTITAPFAGEVIQVDTIEGGQVNAYGPVLTLAAGGKVIARAPVTESQIAGLSPGQPAEIFPGSSPMPLKARVLAVPAAGSKEPDRFALFTLEEPGLGPDLGTNGRAEVILRRQENALLVPLSAIRTFSGRSFVTLVTTEGRQEVAVEIGLQGDSFAEVLNGLKEGDKVVSR